MSNNDEILVKCFFFFFPLDRHTVDLNLVVFSNAGHSCWMSSEV